jgi:hypothetical protein
MDNMMKEIKLGYVDFNKTETKKLGFVDFNDKKSRLYRTSSEKKELASKFCNKLNKAKVYEIILREVK